jgi:hypothetical protein
MKFTLSGLFFFLYGCVYAQLSVNYISANQFVQQWLSPNVFFANVVFSGVDPTQMAAFSGTTNPNFGISNGVMLATGDAMIAADTSFNYANGNALGGGGDPDLSGACQQQTRDLAAIEFDFWTPSDSVEFTFVFASEEYNYWVNSKNDVCGARLYNAGGGYANVIYLPGTFTPVCVNTVNNGTVANVGDPSTGPCMNCQYFYDNTYGSTFKYNGYTSIFTIKMAVTPCDTFHFWIGVADAQDYIYDSAILLPDGSFHGTAPVISAVGYPAGTDTVSICAGTPVTLISSSTGSYSWSSGQTTQQITVDTAGVYFLTSSCGPLSNQIVVLNNAGAQSAFSAPNEICPGACTDFINQSANASAYQWIFPGASPDTSTVVNPVNICYTSSGQYDVTLISIDGTCSDTLTLFNYITVFPASPPQSITQAGDTLMADTGFVSYQWYFNGNLLSGATSVFYVALQSGDYNLIATDSNGCEVEAVINNVLARAQDNPQNRDLDIFPNPVNSILILRSDFIVNKTEIFDLAGKKIIAPSHSSADGRRIELDVSLLPGGVYFLKVTTNFKTLYHCFGKE